MASVHSPFRKLIKPIVYRCLGPSAYRWFFLRGKIRDIEKRLVEEAEMELLPRLVSRGDTVLDIGANFAYYTVRLAHLCPEGQVIAFEPIPSTFDICSRIINHYGLRNVSVHEKGVGAKTETRQFEVPLQELGTHSAGQAHLKGRDNGLAGKEKYHPFANHEVFDCQIVALDEFLGDLKSLSFVKIDIEGAEYFAIQGMRKTIERFKPQILMEVVPYFLKGFGLDESALDHLMSELGYLPFRYIQDRKKLRPKIGAYEDSNYLFIHRDHLPRYSDLILPTESRHEKPASVV